jgi:hypothetical protein
VGVSRGTSNDQRCVQSDGHRARRVRPHCLRDTLQAETAARHDDNQVRTLLGGSVMGKNRSRFGRRLLG